MHNMHLQNVQNIRIKPHAVLNMYMSHHLRPIYNLKTKPSTVKVLNTIIEHNSTKCQLCGLDNMYFKVKGNHITPYYTKADGNPVLVTTDHNLLKSLGGTNNPKNLSLLCMDCNSKRDSISAELPEFLDNPEMKPNFSYIEYYKNLTRNTLNYESDNIHKPLQDCIKLAIHNGDMNVFVGNEAIARYLYAIRNNSTKIKELNKFISTELHKRAFSTIQQKYKELTAREIHHVLKNCKSYELPQVHSLLGRKYLQNNSKRYSTLKTLVQFSNENINRVLMEAHAVHKKVLVIKARDNPAEQYIYPVYTEVHKEPQTVLPKERTFFYMEDTQETHKGIIKYWQKLKQYVKGKFNAITEPKEYRMY